MKTKIDGLTNEPKGSVVLFVDEQEDDSVEAARILRRYHPTIEVAPIIHRDRHTRTPWLVTPVGFFFGLPQIQGFIDQEAKIPLVRNSLSER
jgi:allophanate hydrolase subunit 1